MLQEIYDKPEEEVINLLLENKIPLGSKIRNIINVMHILHEKLSKKEKK